MTGLAFLSILDILDPPAPAQLVNDLVAAGAQGAAGYIYNASVPTGWTLPHFEAVAAAGKAICAIVVPGSSPGPPADCLSVWDPAWPVALDVEAGSQPPPAWAASFWSLVRARGGNPGMYGTAAYQGLYWGLGEAWHWLADWTFVRPAAPPVGYQAIQWTDQVTGASGSRYDGSVFDGALWPPIEGAPEPPGGAPMWYVIVRGTLGAAGNIPLRPYPTSDDALVAGWTAQGIEIPWTGPIVFGPPAPNNNQTGWFPIVGPGGGQAWLSAGDVAGATYH